MTEFKIGRWLFVLVAVVGIALAVPTVGAHGDAPTVHNGTADGWATWMDGHADGHDDHADGHDDHADGHHGPYGQGNGC